jgi:hypothetical protein
MSEQQLSIDMSPAAYSTVTNPRWMDAAHTVLDVDVDFPGLGVVPFTASPDDCEHHGKEIYADCIAGKYGAIADYLADEKALAEKARATRDRLLTGCDWSQLPDVPAATRTAYVAYRAALRDITKQDGFPTSIAWPKAPDV